MRAILQDVDWTVPIQYESGVYRWTIQINIIPIPFISGMIAAIAAQMAADEETLNQSFRDQGIEGTATLISKKVTLKKEWWGTAVSRVTIDYTVAFTPVHLATPLALNHRAMLFAWWALVPIIPVIIKWVVIALVVGVLIVGVQSLIYKIIGPSEYTPYEEGDCAEGWVYDVKKGVCVRSGGAMQDIILLAGLTVAALVLTRRGTK